MEPVVIAVIVIIVVLLAVALYRSRAQPGANGGGSCQTDADCTAPQVCDGGTCTTPAGICSPACVAPQTCVNGSCQTGSGTCDPACVPPQICVNSACATPAQSCYQWVPWTPAAHKGVPSWLVASSGTGGLMTPVGAGDSAGHWYLGGTAGDPSVSNYGVFRSVIGDELDVKPPLFGVLATGNCPKTFASTTDPTRALQFRGGPVCWDFAGVSNAFVPYQNGACVGWDGMGSFQLVAGGGS